MRMENGNITMEKGIRFAKLMSNIASCLFVADIEFDKISAENRNALYYFGEELTARGTAGEKLPVSPDEPKISITKSTEEEIVNCVLAELRLRLAEIGFTRLDEQESFLGLEETMRKIIKEEKNKR